MASTLRPPPHPHQALQQHHHHQGVGGKVWRQWGVVLTFAYLYVLLWAVPARCQVNFAACDNASCPDNSTCVEDINITRGYWCNCSNNEYTGDFCNVTLSNQDCSVNNPCHNGATCTAENASLQCSCAPGYTGSLCESTINYCVDNPCNNGTCSSDPLQQNYTCSCSPGFTGETCDVNMDECVDNKCDTNGTAQCIDQVNSYFCQCHQGYRGELCNMDELECDSNPCMRGRCIETFGSYDCDCSGTGYTETNCTTDVDECAQNFCPNETKTSCLNTEGNYSCTCKDGYKGDNCTIAWCDGQCLSGSTCYDDVQADWGTDWRCDCLPFYGGRQCNISGPCLNTPCNSSNTARCEQDPRYFDNITYANRTCHCNNNFLNQAAWQGVNCSEDVDECTQSNLCADTGTCINLPGSFQCDCDLGYTGDLCERDIDECASNPCQNGGACIEGVGNFTCNCSGTGYQGVTCNVDVDECLLAPCHNGTCNNTIGNYSCDCGALYLGHQCQHRNPCNFSLTCLNHGTCNHTWSADQEEYVGSCTCKDGFHGNRCEQSPQTEEDLNLAIIIGPIVGVVLLLVIIGVIVFIVVARDNRATRGAYSPSRQETAGARVELGNVLKKPPEERLI